MYSDFLRRLHYDIVYKKKYFLIKNYLKNCKLSYFHFFFSIFKIVNWLIFANRCFAFTINDIWPRSKKQKKLLIIIIKISEKISS